MGATAAPGRDPELLLVGADGGRALRARLDELSATGRAPAKSVDEPTHRAAIVATSPAEVAERAAELAAELRDGALVCSRGAFAGGPESARIGFLFPGQAAPVHTGAGALGELVPDAAGVYEGLDLPDADGEVPAERVQLAIVASELAALRALRAAGVEADLALGHSLGELTALHWAGALGEDALLRLARARGEAMTAHGGEGTMASVGADDEQLALLVEGLDVTVACFNSPRQRVVSGSVDAIERLVERGRELGCRARRLPVVGAFHSPLMRAAVPPFERHLAAEAVAAPRLPVLSTITGAELDPDADLRALLAAQIERPVRFVEAATEAAQRVELLIEVGPGRILAGLVAELADTPVVSIRSGERSPRGLLEAVGAAYAAGAPVRAPRATPAGAIA